MEVTPEAKFRSPTKRPRRVLCPVLLVKGEYDGISALADLQSFFAKLPNGDRQLTIIPGAAHAVTMSLNRQALWHVMNAFLSPPEQTA